MAFVNKEIKFILTTSGKKKLIEEGWSNNTKIYYTFFDDGVIYTINAYPKLLPEITGVGNNISETMNFKYNLT